jgi:exodeoxyribonuclease-3
MKIATWNVNSIRSRLEHVVNWLNSNKPDVLAIQELKLEDKNFPVEAFSEIGYHAEFFGQKTYNGVAFLSVKPADQVVKNLPQFDDHQSRVIAATFDTVRIINVYVPNGQSVDSDKYQYKLKWLQALAGYMESELAQHEKLCVLGDFNIAPTDADVHDPKKWEGHVLCSDREREALQSLIQLGFEDAFRLQPQPEKSFTWWDYRQLGFIRNAGLRIDLILLNQALVANCKSVMIDRAPRKWEKPSDHAPVVMELTES